MEDVIKTVRNTDSIYLVCTARELEYRDVNNLKISKYVDDKSNHKCTICDKHIDKPCFHPALKVLICIDCNANYDSNSFPTDDEGTDLNCRWCAQQANEYHCATCTCTFCKRCLQLNFDATFLKNVNINWQCFICQPSQLWFLRATCNLIMKYNQENKLKTNNNVKKSPHLRKQKRNRMVVPIENINAINKQNGPKVEEQQKDVPIKTDIKLESKLLDDFHSTITEAVSQMKLEASRIDKQINKFTEKILHGEKIQTLPDIDKVFKKLIQFSKDISENYTAIRKQTNKEKERLYKNYNFNPEEEDLNPKNNVIDISYEENGYLDRLRTPSSDEEHETYPKVKRKLSLSMKKEPTKSPTKRKLQATHEDPQTHEYSHLIPVDPHSTQEDSYSIHEDPTCGDSDLIHEVPHSPHEYSHLIPEDPHSIHEVSQSIYENDTQLTDSKSIHEEPYLVHEDTQSIHVDSQSTQLNSDLIHEESLPRKKLQETLKEWLDQSKNSNVPCDSKSDTQIVDIDEASSGELFEQPEPKQKTPRLKEEPIERRKTIKIKKEKLDLSQIDASIASRRSSNESNGSHDTWRASIDSQQSTTESKRNSSNLRLSTDSQKTDLNDSRRSSFDTQRTNESPTSTDSQIKCPKKIVRRRIDSKDSTNSIKTQSNDLQRPSIESHSSNESRRLSNESRRLSNESRRLSNESQRLSIESHRLSTDSKPNTTPIKIRRLRIDSSDSTDSIRTQTNDLRRLSIESEGSSESRRVSNESRRIELQRASIEKIKTEVDSEGSSISTQVSNTEKLVSSNLRRASNGSDEDRIDALMSDLVKNSPEISTNLEEIVKSEVDLSKSSSSLNESLNLNLSVESLHIKSESLTQLHEINEEVEVKQEIDELLSHFSEETLILGSNDGRNQADQRIMEDFDEDTQEFTQLNPKQDQAKEPRRITEDFDEDTQEFTQLDTTKQDAKEPRRITEDFDDDTQVFTQLEPNQEPTEPSFVLNEVEGQATQALEKADSEATEIYSPRLDKENSESESYDDSDRERAFMELKYPTSDDTISSFSSFSSDSSFSSRPKVQNGITTHGVTVLHCPSEEDSIESAESQTKDSKLTKEAYVDLSNSRRLVIEWLRQQNFNKVVEDQVNFEKEQEEKYNKELEENFNKAVEEQEKAERAAEEAEINRLINLATLKRKTNDNDKLENTNKKKRKKHQSESGSSLYSNENSSNSYVNSSDLFEEHLDYEDVEFLDLEDENNVSHQESEPENNELDQEELEKPKETKEKPSAEIKDNAIEVYNTQFEKDFVEKEKTWQDDTLLNQNLNLNDSDSGLKSVEAKSVKSGKKRRRSTISSFSKTDSSSSSDDDDVQFVSETTGTRNNKRRNIKEIIEDDTLNETTKEAERLENERKKRLFEKQYTMDMFLSQSSITEETGYVLDIDENKQPLVTIHPKITDMLKPHQLEGIKFMWSICFESVKKANTEPGTGCILAHCMGLGKTRQVVTLSHIILTNEHLKKFKKVLVLCPLSTVLNWKNEYNITLKGLPGIRVQDLGPKLDLRSKFAQIRLWDRQGGVLIMGYDTFKALLRSNRWTADQKIEVRKAILEPGADLVICDEGHLLKDGKSKRFQTASEIATKRRIILTGTPLQNNLKELYYMVNFVKPNLLGTQQEYNNRFVNPIVNGQFEDSRPEDINLMRKRSHVLHKKLETTVQRYESDELEKYMPDKLDYIVYTTLCPLQQKLYQHYLDMLGENQMKRMLFKSYHTLSNIWTHPALLKLRQDKNNANRLKKNRYDENNLDPDPDIIDNQSELEWFNRLIPSDLTTNITYSPKFQILFTIINECFLMGDKLLVFSMSVIELDLIETFLRLSGKNWVKNKHYYRMDGLVESELRQKYCNAFNNPNNKDAVLFLITYRVGGLGLNLFAANRIVLMDVSWNPTYDTQSIYRAYRFGQKKKVITYRLVSMGTMEEVVCSRGITKTAISRRVVDEKQITRAFKSDDLQKMLHLNTDYGLRPTLSVPEDRLLGKLITNYPTILFKYCEHQKLLEVLPHEELNEEDRKKAWEEFESEIKAAEGFKNNQNLPDPNMYSIGHQNYSYNQSIDYGARFINTNRPFQYPRVQNAPYQNPNYNFNQPSTSGAPPLNYYNKPNQFSFLNQFQNYPPAHKNVNDYNQMQSTILNRPNVAAPKRVNGYKPVPKIINQNYVPALNPMLNPSRWDRPPKNANDFNPTPQTLAQNQSSGQQSSTKTGPDFPLIRLEGMRDNLDRNFNQTITTPSKKQSRFSDAIPINVNGESIQNVLNNIQKLQSKNNANKTITPQNGSSLIEKHLTTNVPLNIPNPRTQRDPNMVIDLSKVTPAQNMYNTTNVIDLTPEDLAGNPSSSSPNTKTNCNSNSRLENDSLARINDANVDLNSSQKETSGEDNLQQSPVKILVGNKNRKRQRWKTRWNKPSRWDGFNFHDDYLNNNFEYGFNNNNQRPPRYYDKDFYDYYGRPY